MQATPGLACAALVYVRSSPRLLPPVQERSKESKLTAYLQLQQWHHNPLPFKVFVLEPFIRSPVAIARHHYTPHTSDNTSTPFQQFPNNFHIPVGPRALHLSTQTIMSTMLVFLKTFTSYGMPMCTERCEPWAKSTEDSV